MWKVIEIRFGDETPKYFQVGPGIHGIVKAHLTILEYMEKRNIFPVLSDPSPVSNQVIAAIAKVEKILGTEDAHRATVELHVLRELYQKLRSYSYDYVDCLKNPNELFEIYERVNQFWSLFCMRYGMFLGDNELPRGYTVSEHKLIEYSRELLEYND